MNHLWQDWTALAIVAAACGYLLRKAWLLLSVKQPAHCGGGCSGCRVHVTKGIF